MAGEVRCRQARASYELRAQPLSGVVEDQCVPVLESAGERCRGVRAPLVKLELGVLGDRVVGWDGEVVGEREQRVDKLVPAAENVEYQRDELCVLLLGKEGVLVGLGGGCLGLGGDRGWRCVSRTWD